MSLWPDTFNAVAVIGMSGQFPGADETEQFWKNLAETRCSITDLSDDELRENGVSDTLLRDPNYVKRAAVINGISTFDYALFGIAPKEAQAMDPQHRLLLEHSYHALSSAGILDAQDATAKPDIGHASVGVFVATKYNGYLLNNVYQQLDTLHSLDDLQQLVASDRSFAATRIAHFFNFRGPALSLDTACSSSLVSVHQACRSLVGFECDLALAGGVTVNVPQRVGYLFREGSIQSPDGYCRAFDARAAGTVFGNGIGLVCLKRLDDVTDQDNVLAVIRGSAINNDGGEKVGFWAPGAVGQQEVIAAALDVAGISPEYVSYIATHGTGTALGDPIEVHALAESYESAASQSIAISSLKASIGHLEVAAGVASLIQSIQALQHQQLPANYGYESPNPAIDFTRTPFYVNTQSKPWDLPECGERIAAVSAFGIGGTNCHLLVSEAPNSVERYSKAELQTKQTRLAQPMILPFSSRAGTESELQHYIHQVLESWRQRPWLAAQDIATTLQQHRHAFAERSVIVVDNNARERSDDTNAQAQQVGEYSYYREAYHHCADPHKATKAVFVFGGQGLAIVDQLRGLLGEATEFTTWVEKGFAWAKQQFGLDLRAVWESVANDSAAPEMRHQVDAVSTENAQPLIYCLEYALAKQWQAWGVTPKYLCGHSLGEWIAAAFAEVVSFEAGLGLVVQRAKLMQQTPEGGMLSVQLSSIALEKYLAAEPSLVIAISNTPELHVVSGPIDSIERLAGQLHAEQITAKRLPSDRAFHSSLMQAAAQGWQAHLLDGQSFLTQTRLQAPRIPILSNVTGELLTEQQAASPYYWVNQMLSPVKFCDNIQWLKKQAAHEHLALIDISPSGKISQLCTANGVESSWIISHENYRSTTQQQANNGRDWCWLALHLALGKFWAVGGNITWPNSEQGTAAATGQVVHLPPMPLAQQECWLEPSEVAPESRTVSHASDRIHYADPQWQRLYLAQPASRHEQGTNNEHSDQLAKDWIVFDQAHWKDAVQHLAAQDDTVTLLTEKVAEDYDFSSMFSRWSDAEPPRVIYLALSVFYDGVETLGLHTDVANTAENADFYVELAMNSLHRFIAQLHEFWTFKTPIVCVLQQQSCSVMGEPLSAQSAMLIPAWHSLGFECHTRVHVIDTSLVERDLQALQQVAQQYLLENESPQSLAIRHGCVWQPVYAESTPVSQGSIQSVLTQVSAEPNTKKHYVIFGGLGAIGLAWVHFLQGLFSHSADTPSSTEAQANIRFTLVGRRDIHAVQDGLTALHEQGIECEYVNQDIGDSSALQRLLDSFTQCDGIIHCAGVPGQGMALTRDAQERKQLLAVKVFAGRVLMQWIAQRERPLDMVIFNSSMMSLMGGPGQFEYAAANRYLDSLAQANTTATPVVSVVWDGWRNVGMAANISGAQLSSASSEMGATTVNHDVHPLTPQQIAPLTWAVTIDENDWYVDEHRLDGTRVIPGTLYVALFDSVAEQLINDGEQLPHATHLAHIRFLEPAMVEEECRLKLVATPQDEGYQLSIYQWTHSGEHLIASAQLLAPEIIEQSAMPSAPDELSPDASALIQQLLPIESQIYIQGVEFGAHWQCLQRVAMQETLIACEFKLGEFADELNDLPLHPALLDMATGVAPGALYLESQPESVKHKFNGGIYLPAEYAELRRYRPLTPHIYSIVEVNDTEPGSVVLNIDIVDSDLNLLLTVTGLRLQHVPLTVLHRSLTSNPFKPVLDAALAHQMMASIVERLHIPNTIVTDRPVESRLAQWRQALNHLVYTEDGEPVDIDDERDVTTTVIAIWRQFIGVDDIQETDNFFELGGHSLMATQVTARIKAVYGIEFPLQQLLTQPTIAACVSYIEETLGSTALESGDDGQSATTTAQTAVIQRAEPKDAYPLFHAQQRLWFAQQLDGPSGLYNEGKVLCIDGELDVGALNQALVEIVNHHDILRSVYPMVNGEAQMRIMPPVSEVLTVTELAESAADGSSVQERLQRMIDSECQRNFDLLTGPLYRIKLIKTNTQQSHLIFLMHHMICDGLSLALILQELEQRYSNTYRQPAANSAQYADFIAYHQTLMTEQKVAQEQAYWQAQLANLKNAQHELPAASAKSSQGVLFDVQLAQAEYQRITDFAKSQKVSPFVVFVSAYHLLLKALIPSDNLVISTPVTHRDQAELQTMVGLFINTVALNFSDSLSDATTGVVQDAVQADSHAWFTAQHHTVIQSLAHANTPFDNIIDAVFGDDKRAAECLHQYRFVFLEGMRDSFSFADLTLTPQPLTRKLAKFDLMLTVEDCASNYFVEFEVRKDVLTEADQQQLTEHYQWLVNALVSEQPATIQEIYQQLQARVQAVREQQNMQKKQQQMSSLKGLSRRRSRIKTT